jgi:thymidylate kinase
MPLVILEGVNGIGKSTVSRFFTHIHFPTGDNKCSEEVLNNEFYTDRWGIEFRRNPEDINAQRKARLDILANKELLEDLSKGENILISDRSIISNFLYSSVKKGVVYSFLNSINTEIIIVILYARDSSILKERVLTRSKKCSITDSTIDKIIDELDLVNKIFKLFTLDPAKLNKEIPIVRLPVDDLSPEELAEKIKNICEN